jgi:glycosyltransferase involved in cell wall biosynthesis
MDIGGLRTKGFCKKAEENKPLITVVTVVYNGEDNLEQTIISVINQKYKNIEYLIIDGVSKDNTLNIIKKYENRIDYWISESDKGIYDAMNKGICLAKGDFINFMNCGDSFYSDMTIYSSVRYMIDNNNIDVFYGNTLTRFNSGIYTVRAEEKIKNRMSDMPFCHQSTFTKTNLLKERNFVLKFKVMADYDFFRYLYINRKIFKYIPLTISRYDAIDGYSLRHPIKLLIEKYTVNGFLKQKINYFLFGFLVIYTLTKLYMRKIVPNTILNLLRSLKYRNS